MKTIGHRISGKVIEPKESRYGDVYNPATGEVEGKVALASIAEVNQAVESAKNSLPEWSAMPPIQRARILFKFKEFIIINQGVYLFIMFFNENIPPKLASSDRTSVVCVDVICCFTLFNDNDTPSILTPASVYLSLILVTLYIFDKVCKAIFSCSFSMSMTLPLISFIFNIPKLYLLRISILLHY